ncbi:MAG: fused MFS/spermidine synthase [Intrasporangiaceae bacterium]|nr:fused MFS/spermidine synthase [Intrasporangiaceae bacterium]
MKVTAAPTADRSAARGRRPGCTSVSDIGATLGRISDYDQGRGRAGPYADRVSEPTESDVDAGPDATASTTTAPLASWAAAALVFGSSAAVLVVELVALRLLAPYLGLTLETNTLVIGVALAAIAFGSWVGGWWADRVDPRRVLAPLLGVSAVVVAATPFLVRGSADAADGALLLLVAAATIIVPGALLSAVTPMVIKLMLASLSETGTIVGRLSGIGTVGAIFGTVVTGFILISRLSVSWIMVGLGLALLLAAVVVGLRIGRTPARTVAAGTGAALLLGAATVVFPSGCDTETIYHCVTVDADPERPDGRLLVMDGLRHSYVDLEDPTHLEFDYVRAIAAGIDARFEDGAPLTVHSIGAGGLTLPRHLDADRPGTTGSVSEVDPGVIRVDREALALPESLDLDIRVEDGRLGLQTLPAGEVDVVIGDAFGGVSVPWHLTTREASLEIDRTLADNGIYLLNLIDYGPLAFARAELATLRDSYPHVALAWSGRGGNLVATASRAPIDVPSWQSRLDARDVAWSVLAGEGLDDWIGDSPVLTDDFAPVDQLLTPYPSGAAAG